MELRETERTLYERVGGDAYFHTLVHRFYEGVESDPVLRPIYPEDLGPGKFNLAEFLVQTAIGFTRFRAGSPTVGGPIEIAAITKHDGFLWVRHKEYYDRSLNADYF